MTKTRKSVEQYETKEEFLAHYRHIRNRRDKAAAESVRLTNVLRHLNRGAHDRGWSLFNEDLG